MGWLVVLIAVVAMWQANQAIGFGGDTAWTEAAKKAKKKRDAQEQKKSEDSKE